MHRLLLGAAAAMAAVVTVSPAWAQGAAATAGFSSISVHRSLPGLGMAHHVDNRRGDLRRTGGEFRHIRVGDSIGGGWGYGYNYDDYDINASWGPESFNDWWHDRPDRAYPRWMARNRDCSRRWYSGDTLTC